MCCSDTVISFFKYLEQWERYEPSNFWLCTIFLSVSLSVGSGILFSQSQTQSHVVIQTIRGGKDDLGFTYVPTYPSSSGTTRRETNSGTQDKTSRSQSSTKYQPKPGTKLRMVPGPEGDPGNGNGGYSWENDNSIPPEERWKYDSGYWDNYKYNPEDFKKKNKESDNQCELEENVEKQQNDVIYEVDLLYERNEVLRREAEKARSDKQADKDIDHLIEQLSLGNLDAGIGSKTIKSLKNTRESRGRNRGRVYFRKRNGKIEVLGISNKNNQKKVIKLLRDLGY